MPSNDPHGQRSANAPPRSIESEAKSRFAILLRRASPRGGERQRQRSVMEVRSECSAAQVRERGIAMLEEAAEQSRLRIVAERLIARAHTLTGWRDGIDAASWR